MFLSAAYQGLGASFIPFYLDRCQHGFQMSAYEYLHFFVLQLWFSTSNFCSFKYFCVCHIFTRCRADVSNTPTKSLICCIIYHLIPFSSLKTQILQPMRYLKQLFTVQRYQFCIPVPCSMPSFSWLSEPFPETCVCPTHDNSTKSR